MQRTLICNLIEMRNQNMNKALLISATGTGKTYAAAFAMSELGFKRVLFVVHRKQIAKQAKASFERVLGVESRQESYPGMRVTLTLIFCSLLYKL